MSAHYILKGTLVFNINVWKNESLTFQDTPTPFTLGKSFSHAAELVDYL